MRTQSENNQTALSAGKFCFSFASDWLRKWREYPEPITERSEKKMQLRIAFDTHLKIAL